MSHGCQVKKLNENKQKENQGVEEKNSIWNSFHCTKLLNMREKKKRKSLQIISTL
jgi:predicted site-specific integrase-resolvase